MTEEQKFPYPVSFETDTKMFEYPVPQGQEWMAALLYRQERHLITIKSWMTYFEILSFLSLLVIFFWGLHVLFNYTESGYKLRF